MTSNIKPKTIFTGDNLPIMRGINSESVDLIYLDPPFNSNANYAAPNLEVDHIIAETSGGTDHIDNLQLLCSHCNRVKGDRGQEYLISRLNKD